MRIEFSKYQGTGNDFVMLNNVNGRYDDLSLVQIQLLCSRKNGIGADGLIKLSAHNDYNFEVEYYNSDGSQSFCGNGARCAVAFAKKLGLIDQRAIFLAIDGHHHATISEDEVEVEMLPVNGIELELINGGYVLDTGSPHYVKIVNADNDIDIVEFGREIRYSEKFKEQGINVNLMSVVSDNEIRVSTYERGVEDETLSCGTGVTACALIYMLAAGNSINRPISVHTKGGTLTVKADDFVPQVGFMNISLSGSAKHVFDGSIDV